MPLPMLLIASALLTGAATIPAAATEVRTAQHEAFSAAKKRKKSGQQARSGTQIACTPAGCHPIPPGCRIRTGFNPWTWDPTGYDEVVCPYRR